MTSGNQRVAARPHSAGDVEAPARDIIMRRCATSERTSLKGRLTRRGLDCAQLEFIEALEPLGRPLHPAGERRAVEMDTLPGQNLHLSIHRQKLGEL